MMKIGHEKCERWHVHVYVHFHLLEERQHKVQERERESEREGEGAMDTITSTIMSRNRAWNSMSTQKNT